MQWYSRVVFRWRTMAAVFWLLAVATVLLLLLQMTTALLGLNHVTWLGSFVLFFLFLVVMGGISMSHAVVCVVPVKVCQSRVSKLLALVHPVHCVTVILYCASGGVASLCLAGFIGVGEATLTCSNGPCLNQKLLLLICHGLFSGFWYGIQFFVRKEHVLVLPLCQQPKLFVFQGDVFSHFRHAFSCTVKGLKIFIPAYVLCGGALELRLCSLLGIPSSDVGLLRMLSVGSLVYSAMLILVCGTINHLMWRLGLLLFRIFQTEVIAFPVVATFAEQSTRLLTLALKAESIPLLKLLAFADLSHLAQFSAYRRKQVYSLTSLGTPAVWEDIHAECTSVLQKLLAKLRAITSQKVKASKKKEKKDSREEKDSQREKDSQEEKDSEKEKDSQKGKGKASKQEFVKGWRDDAGVMSPPGTTRRHFHIERARLVSGPLEEDEEKVACFPVSSSDCSKINWEHLASSFKKWLKGDFKKWLKNWLKGVFNKCKKRLKKVFKKCKKRPFFSYFIGDLPDATTQEAFVQGQLYVCAITGLVHLSAASYTEDTRGVVQKTLPATISLLLELSQLLEKEVRQPFGRFVKTCSLQLAWEINGKHSIKSAVQTGLHLLACTFQKEMRALELSPEQIEAWRKFLPTEQQSIPHTSQLYTFRLSMC